MHSDGFGEVTDTGLTPASSPGIDRDLARLAESEALNALRSSWGDDVQRRSGAQPRRVSSYEGDDEPTKTLHRSHIAPALGRGPAIPPLPNLAQAGDDEPTRDYTSPGIGVPRPAARTGAPSPFPPAPSGRLEVPAAGRTPRSSSSLRATLGTRGRRDSIAGRTSSVPGTGLPAGAFSQHRSSGPSSKPLGVAPPAASAQPPAAPPLRRTAPLAPPLSAAIRMANEARVQESLNSLERAAASRGSSASLPSVVAQPVSASVLPVRVPVKRTPAVPAFPIAPPTGGGADPLTPPTEEYVPAHRWSLESKVVEARFDDESEPGHVTRVLTRARSWRLAFGNARAIVQQPAAAGATVVPRPDRRWLVVAVAIAFGLCAACTAAWVLTRTPQASAALETGPSDAEVARIMQARTGFIVSTYPSGARIHVDGRETGRFTPDRVTGLTPGLHSIELKLAGYYDTNLPAVLEEGATLVLPPVELRPLPPAPPTEEP